MSKVKNEPKYKNGLLQAIRAQLEHRAFWLYLLCDEAEKKGLRWEDFAPAAIRRCGLSQGAGLVKKGKTDSLKGLRKTLFTKPAQLVFEMKIQESTDDTLNIDFHYCPLVPLHMLPDKPVQVMVHAALVCVHQSPDGKGDGKPLWQMAGYALWCFHQNRLLSYQNGARILSCAVLWLIS